MKIIQLCAIDQTMKVFLEPLVRGLMQRGYEVTGVCSGGPYTEELRKEGIRMVNIPIARRIKLFSNLVSVYRLYRLFRIEKPDVVHAHSPIASVLGRVAARLAGVPVIIYTAHGFYFHDNMPPLKYWLFLNVEKYTARFFTDFIFTQSNEDRLTAIRNGFLSEDRIVCIGNGVDIYDRFNPQKADSEEIRVLREEFGLAEGDTVITFIGRLVEEKGIVELLEAFSGICANVKLLVVGDVDQGCRDQWTKERITDGYSSDKRIVFTGFRRDISNILYITDIFCLPSHREGMPRTIIEAMAMNCAVIATDIRGCREEVTEDVTGFLVKPRASDIREKLELLISDRELLDSMKAHGRKKAEKYYDENAIIDSQISIINRLFQHSVDRTGAKTDTRWKTERKYSSGNTKQDQSLIWDKGEYMEHKKTVLDKGIFTLSLDVELCWGTIDKPGRLHSNKEYYEKSRECTDKLLKLLEDYDISATWAVVGHLFLRECTRENGRKHPDIPRSTYPWYDGDWFEESPCSNEKEAPLWYGRDIIEKIAGCGVHQEIACHSFAHIPFGDGNTRRETVRADLSHCIREAEKEGLRLRSFVFPRNNEGYIDELANFGFEAFRGGEPTWFRHFHGKARKLCYILDQFIPAGPPVSMPAYDRGLINIPGSMQYLPMNGIRRMLPLGFRVQKARRGIKKAIRDKGVFHLWFHPFNLATDQEKLFCGLEEIFQEVKRCRDRGLLDCKNMEDIAAIIKFNRQDVIYEG